MTMKRELAFAAIYLLWGGSYLAIKLVVQVVPPILAAAIRYSLGGLILLALSLCLRRDVLSSRRQVFNSMASGVAMFGFGYAVVFWAETRLASWLVAVLAATTFLWTYLGECLLFRIDEVRKRILLPLLVGLLGMPLLVGASFHQQRMHSILAIAGVLAGSLSWSAGTLLIRKLDLPRSPMQTAGLQIGAAGLSLLAISWRLHEWDRLPPLSQCLNRRPLFAMAYLVVGGSVIAFGSFHWLLMREKASLVATYTYINPIVAMVVGVLFAHERQSVVQLLGACTLLLSVALVWHAQRPAGRSASLTFAGEHADRVESSA